jgi:hypothetical protein
MAFRDDVAYDTPAFRAAVQEVLDRNERIFTSLRNVQAEMQAIGSNGNNELPYVPTIPRRDEETRWEATECP